MAKKETIHIIERVRLTAEQLHKLAIGIPVVAVTKGTNVMGEKLGIQIKAPE